MKQNPFLFLSLAHIKKFTLCQTQSALSGFFGPTIYHSLTISEKYFFASCEKSVGMPRVCLCQKKWGNISCLGTFNAYVAHFCKILWIVFQTQWAVVTTKRSAIAYTLYVLSACAAIWCWSNQFHIFFCASEWLENSKVGLRISSEHMIQNITTLVQKLHIYKNFQEVCFLSMLKKLCLRKGTFT